MKPLPYHNTKIGRNEKCPCGSGKKYKQCHGSSIADISNKLHLGRINADLRKFARSKECLVPDFMKSECNHKIIKSHSVSRSGSLKLIERNSHVYWHDPSLLNLDFDLSSQFKLVGINEASTFPGFCNKHDSEIFSPLETKKFTGTAEQCFLLAYRSVCLEIYKKNILKKQHIYKKAIFSQNKDQNLLEDFDQGVNLGLLDLMDQKKSYDDILKAKNFNSCKYVLFEFDEIFPIQSTCSYQVDIDINGNRIQKYHTHKKALDSICIISFAADSKSYICFFWLQKSNDICSQYMEPILKFSREQLPALFGSIILQSSENSYISPSWYENLDQNGREWCALQILSCMFFPVPPPIHFMNNTYFKDILASCIKSSL